VQEHSGKARSECDGTRAENRIGLSAQRTSPFKSADFCEIWWQEGRKEGRKEE